MNGMGADTSYASTYYTPLYVTQPQDIVNDDHAPQVIDIGQDPSQVDGLGGVVWPGAYIRTSRGIRCLISSIDYR